jgi:arsenate reductase (thioredoxin)
LENIYRNIAIYMRKILIFCGFLLLLGCQTSDNQENSLETEVKKNELNMALFPTLQAYADSLTFEFEQIPEERREALRKLAAYVQAQRDSGKTVRLTFICTHNSRRSHMGQIWAAAAAAYYGVDDLETYSGGTEATAFNPRAVAAMERAGFLINNPGGDNPRYLIHIKEGDRGLRCFSKKYDDPANPQNQFAAVMTCSQADAECPFIPGASFRLSLPYNDPKEADNTPEEQSRYDERCRQIGREMMYAFSML